MSPGRDGRSLTADGWVCSVRGVGTQSTTILQWVIALVEDPERLAAFQADPASVIESDPDLEPRQKQVL